jgi:hypothetical protein
MQSYGLDFVARLSNERSRRIIETTFTAISVISLGSLAFMLTGCTLLPIKKLQPVIAPPAACTDNELKASDLKTSEFGYEYPTDDVSGNARTMNVNMVNSFEKYKTKIKTRVDLKLPQELSTDRVVIAFSDFLTAVSAKAQLDAQVADGTLTDASLKDSEIASIQKYSAAPNLKHSELKAFANKFFEFQLKRGSSDLFTEQPDPKILVINSKQNATAISKKLDGDFIAYLKAYYNGTFYDRFSTAITKPQLPNTTNLASSLSSFSVPDSEIVAAETVLLEFLIDTIDKTPVMGNTKCPNPGTPATCNPGTGSTVTASAILAVGDSQHAPLPTDVPNVTIVANPTTVLPGSSSALTVTATNTTTAMTITKPDGSIYDPRADNSLTGSTVYIATATGKLGKVSASAAVTVGAAVAPTISITANPASVKAGGYSTLTVTATNATSVAITGSDGSTYSLKTGGGTQTVHPTSTTTYTATAINLPSTTYYPGNSTNQPTALATGMAQYVQLPSGTDENGKPSGACGITTQNVWVLQTLANGASDEASTVGGLIANTPGGISIGLGVIGKISIGDNATLSDLVKTAASEMALRSTLFVSYYTLHHVKFTPIQIPGASGQAASTP